MWMKSDSEKHSFSFTYFSELNSHRFAIVKRFRQESHSFGLSLTKPYLKKLHFIKHCMFFNIHSSLFNLFFIIIDLCKITFKSMLCCLNLVVLRTTHQFIVRASRRTPLFAMKFNSHSSEHSNQNFNSSMQSFLFTSKFDMKLFNSVLHCFSFKMNHLHLNQICIVQVYLNSVVGQNSLWLN